MPFLSQLMDAPVANDVEISMITADSRQVQPGALFAAIPGTAVDGRDYIESAIAKGASAVLSTKGLADMPVTYVGVDEPRLTYSQIAARFAKRRVLERWVCNPMRVIAR